LDRRIYIISKFKTFIKIITSRKEKLSVHKTILLFNLAPYPIINWAKAIGVNNS